MKRLIVSVVLLLPAMATGQDEYLVDWKRIGREANNHLVNLIKIDTSNPPGNETAAALYLQKALDAEEISSTPYALDPDRANLVARIKGNGSKRPILVMGHTDVVGVQRDQWTVDPFSGVRKDGYIYGRGALDDKDNVTAGLMLMLMLRRFEVELDRDIIFLAEAGEEGTPEVGINFMVEKHWDVIDAEFCLAEGGGARAMDGKVFAVGIQTTEKMPRRARLIARGTAGHGSMPRIDNAVTILATAVARAGAWQTPVRFNNTTRAYFERIATISEPEDAQRYRDVTDPAKTDEVQQYFAEHSPYHYSVLRTSVVPTVLDGGFRRNVIPSEAHAVLDIRMLPDEDVLGFYAELAAVIDDPRVEIEPESIYRPAAPPSAIDNEMFRALETISARMYPGAITLPTMATGATDMAQVRARGMQAYGFGPVRETSESTGGGGAHGDDERIREQALTELVQFLWTAILEIAATR